MNAREFAELLMDVEACAQARDWAEGRTPSRAWAECQRGDWMIWFAARMGVDGRLVTDTLCDVIVWAMEVEPMGDPRLTRPIDGLRRWTAATANWRELSGVSWPPAGAREYALRLAIENAVATAWAYGRDPHNVYAHFLANDAVVQAVRHARHAVYTAEEQTARIVRRRIPWETIEPLTLETQKCLIPKSKTK
jgi:hypothetical protein